EDIDKLRSALDDALREYRREYAEYYRAHARADSPPMRDPNPTVALIPGVGMFSFGKSKAEARITGEFYLNAIHVMEGATALGDRDAAVWAAVDIRHRSAIRSALREAVMAFGGVDVLINTAAVIASSPDGRLTDDQWRLTLDVNVTGNYLLADELRGILLD